MEKLINPNPESGKRFYQKFNDKGKVVMLNLLKFRQKADYTGFDQIKPIEDLSGKQAYQLYLEYTSPILKKAGGKVIYYGKSNDFLIGPESEKWDAVLLVEHQSAEKFMEFAQNKDYLKTAGHRTAGLEDSRLLPSTEVKDRP